MTESVLLTIGLTMILVSMRRLWKLTREERIWERVFFERNRQ